MYNIFPVLYIPIQYNILQYYNLTTLLFYLKIYK